MVQLGAVLVASKYTLHRELNFQMHLRSDSYLEFDDLATFGYCYYQYLNCVDVSSVQLKLTSNGFGQV